MSFTTIYSYTMIHDNCLMNEGTDVAGWKLRETDVANSSFTDIIHTPWEEWARLQTSFRQRHHVNRPLFLFGWEVLPCFFSIRTTFVAETTFLWNDDVKPSINEMKPLKWIRYIWKRDRKQDILRSFERPKMVYVRSNWKLHLKWTTNQINIDY